MDIEVFALVVLFVLNMPYPFAWGFVSFLRPDILIFVSAFNFIGLDPILGDVFLVASADGTTFGFA